MHTNLYIFSYQFIQVDSFNNNKKTTNSYVNIVAADSAGEAIIKFNAKYPHVDHKTVKIVKLCQVNYEELSVVKQVLNAMVSLAFDVKAEELVY